MLTHWNDELLAIVEPFWVSAAVLINGGAWCACCVQFGGICDNTNIYGSYRCNCPSGGYVSNGLCPVSARRRPPGTGPGLVPKI